jgi:hypothetical protein
MNTPKIFTLLVTTIILVVSGIYFFGNDPENSAEASISMESLLQDFQEALNDVNNQDAILSYCQNPQEFSERIQTLETNLDILKKRKEELIKEMNPTPALPEIAPGSMPLELSDGDYTIPGSVPLELSDGDYTIPGSVPIELSDGDYTIPGSAPLELSDGDYGSGSPELDAINKIENDIAIELEKLKSACNEEETAKENDCVPACQNYVNRCLTLVPNATQSLFNQGMESCEFECKTWDNSKITCMERAMDCPSMTEVCGL